MTGRLWLLILFLSAVSCVEPYDPQLKGGTKYLVFEGTLTNAPGPYRFTLTFSAGYNSQESVFDERVKGATMTLSDDQNRRTIFLDDGRGNFSSPAGFRGETDRTYTLSIAYQGMTYRSDPELLRPVAPIDTVYTRFQPIAQPGSTINGEFKVFIDVIDPPGEENYYQWDWIHFEKADQCLLFRPSGTNVTYAQRCCSDCWNITRSTGQILLASDRLINGRRLSGQRVGAVPNDDISPYYLRIGQQSLNRGAYQYWLAIQNLTGNVGSVFDVPPAALTGNLRNTNPAGPPLLGYFQVSARREKIVYINRLSAPLLPFAVSEFPFWSTCTACTESSYRTEQRPDGWR
ncbi:DUF4249 domain-containing protein [Spirosoma linguale]|uniref:DUF4249 domain-containing protein n=1 Tax=Spirosoma linguale (strain ATCC 33905 / DSM 74 / LMG 10896 / Claus 1) TaxID=504472 RepID=D2QKA2_SPILD|nr:hypothetical protein Slin_2915 [Spirosoma linguale DSM 74]